MYYFPETKPNTWNILDALNTYDQKFTEYTFLELMKEMKSDLILLKKAQKTLTKYIESALADLNKLSSLNCLGKISFYNSQSNEQSPGQTETEANRSQNTTTDKTSPEHSTQNPSAQTPLSNTYTAHSSEPFPTVNNPVRIASFSGNFMNGSGPVNLTYKNNSLKRPLDDITNSQSTTDEQQANVILTEGQKKYVLRSPNNKSDVLHHPKIRKSHLDSLNGIIHFGTSFTSYNSVSTNVYKAYEQEQKKNSSLRNSGLLDYIVQLLNNDDLFIKQLWTTQPEGLTDKGAILLEIIRHTLTTFHLVLRNVSLQTGNHERTPFVENIVPSLLAISKVTGFVDFKWCETEFTSNKQLNLSDSNFKQTSSKYTDALGFLRTSNNMEIVVVESSSGIQKERTVHTIEDTLKLLECGIASLRKEAALNRNASADTFKKLKVFTIQIIKNQVTLSELYMNDSKSWCFIEKRTATLPSTWHDRIFLVRYLELIATLFDDLCDTQYVIKQLTMENLGLVSNQELSIGNILGE